MPHFSYHLQIFYVDDTTETAKVKKYCLWGFFLFFKFSLFPFNFPHKMCIFCSQDAVLGQRIGGCNCTYYYEVSQGYNMLVFKKSKKGYLWI